MSILKVAYKHADTKLMVKLSSFLFLVPMPVPNVWMPLQLRTGDSRSCGGCIGSCAFVPIQLVARKNRVFGGCMSQCHFGLQPEITDSVVACGPCVSAVMAGLCVDAVSPQSRKLPILLWLYGVCVLMPFWHLAESGQLLISCIQCINSLFLVVTTLACPLYTSVTLCK